MVDFQFNGTILTIPMSCTADGCVDLLMITTGIDDILEPTENFSVSLDAAILDLYPLITLPPEMTIEIEDFESKFDVCIQ